MAVEDYIAEATTEINAAKPINKNSNGEVIELSDAEYDAKITALATQKDYDANQSYKDKRAAEYPSIPDQLDDIYHNGIDAWKATIKVTKDKYPKP
jgi:hypothetical protein|tara:strand:+ start:812 stop:1099 length:288 start_codon:yes stop_codon:yes gene_type:complete